MAEPLRSLILCPIRQEYSAQPSVFENFLRTSSADLTALKTQSRTPLVTRPMADSLLPSIARAVGCLSRSLPVERERAEAARKRADPSALPKHARLFLTATEDETIS